MLLATHSSLSLISVPSINTAGQLVPHSLLGSFRREVSEEVGANFSDLPDSDYYHTPSSFGVFDRG